MFTVRYVLFFECDSFFSVFQKVHTNRDYRCGTDGPESMVSLKKNGMLQLVATHSAKNNSVSALHSIRRYLFGANFHILSFLLTHTADTGSENITISLPSPNRFY